MRESYTETEKDNHFCVEGEEPFKIFRKWFSAYISLEMADANAMALGTVDAEGFPIIRYVLCKDYSPSGFIFYTNYKSEKGQNISLSNQVTLNFYWKEVNCQVRVKGYAEKVEREKSKSYFDCRPYLSQVAAVTSKQSSILETRKRLLDEFSATQKSFTSLNIECPSHWGGYIVKPVYFEFWRGRENRLHERVIFNKVGNEWRKSLLYP